MSYFSSVVVAFCVASIIIGVLYMLSPDGEISKTVKYVLGLCFILSVITAVGINVKKKEFDFSLPVIQNSDTSALDIANAKYAYGIALQKAGIDFSEITVCTDKLSDGSIVINKVIIRSDCEKDKILSAFGETSKIYEVEIINE